MTEVASNLPVPPAGGQVLSVRHYEAGPPANVVAELEVSAPPVAFAPPVANHFTDVLISTPPET